MKAYKTFEYLKKKKQFLEEVIKLNQEQIQELNEMMEEIKERK